MEKKLVGGEILYTDSTHVKAKANKHKKTTVTIEKSPKAYMEELDAAIAADRDALGKKPFEKKDDDEPPTTQIQQSKNDPESGQLHKEGKPDGFHYSEHRTVDSKNNIVVNVRITPANVNDVDPVTDILDDIEKRLGHLPSYMGVDAGYHNAPTCHQIASRGIQPVVGYRRHTHKGEHWGKYHFVYQKDKNVYLCPQKHELTWKTTNRAGYREYWSDSKVCSNCPCREKCLSSSKTRRLVTRHVWQDDLEQADAFTKTLNGKRIYAWRKQTIERSFAEAKELHGLRYARMLGIRNMYEQSFLTAAVQNMKRIVKAIFSCFISLLYAKTPYPLLKTWRFSAVWPPLKGEVPAKRAEGFRSAATTTKQQETAPTLQAEPSKRKGATQTPTALRERGSGGEALLSEKRPLPQRLSILVFPGGSAREGAFLQKSPLPRNTLNILRTLSRCL